MSRNWYRVGELIARLRRMPQDANVLLRMGEHDAVAALEDTHGLPGAVGTVGANSVFEYDPCNVYIVCSTRPDCDDFEAVDQLEPLTIAVLDNAAVPIVERS